MISSFCSLIRSILYFIHFVTFINKRKIKIQTTCYIYLYSIYTLLSNQFESINRHHLEHVVFSQNGTIFNIKLKYKSNLEF